ncbi:MAG: oxidative stress defense protein [Chloroflexi bacterium OLB14]|nr:MAG: oxidative stress defense protein [Chloroflexi bacterium OLB14]
MNSKPDTIKISINHKEEISATHADLHVTVKGSSIVSGDEAMKKAKEVNQLVEALTNYKASAEPSRSIKEEAIKLQGVHLETESGVLLKSSSAVYRLKIRCEDLNQLAGMLDIISSQKNTTLERIEWKYNEDDARNKMLQMAIEKAKLKAAQVAGALNVKLLGVYDLIENIYDEEMPLARPQAMMMKSRAALADAPSLSMDIQHTKTLHVNLEIWYRVSSF